MRHPVIAALVITLLVVLVVPPLGLGQAEADAEWSVHKDEDVYYRYPQKWIVLRESDPTVITDPAQIEYDNAKVPKFLG